MQQTKGQSPPGCDAAVAGAGAALADGAGRGAEAAGGGAAQRDDGTHAAAGDGGTGEVRSENLKWV